jgi:predicted ATPase
MIRKIHLRNIKCFADQVIPFSGLNFLTGINGAGKSSVIQSILLIMQSEKMAAIEFNGPLAEIGAYSDLQHDNAPDDGAFISLSSELGTTTWGYGEGYLCSKDEVITQLPLLDDNKSGIQLIKESLVYISAERWGPRTNVPLNTNNLNPYWLGKHGEYTIQFLHSLNTNTLRNDEGQSVANVSEQDPRLHPDDVGNLIFSNIIAWMGEITPNVTIDASVIREADIGYSSFSFNGGNKYKATNVGFGLSYALSIVTSLMAAKSGSTVILENPEAHLHPKGQSKLGQLMALTAKSGVQVIVETHSEHVVNGARIMVRINKVPKELINVMFISRNEKKKKSDIEFLDVNEMGQITAWPEGFFDQQSIDMKTLITGK